VNLELHIFSFLRIKTILQSAAFTILKRRSEETTWRPVIRSPIWSRIGMELSLACAP
jgi:hypothetical protein